MKEDGKVGEEKGSAEWWIKQKTCDRQWDEENQVIMRRRGRIANKGCDRQKKQVSEGKIIHKQSYGGGSRTKMAPNW